MAAENNRKWNKGKIAYSVFAVLFFGILFAVTYRDRGDVQEKITVPYVIMGDSIYGDCRDESSIPALLSDKLGETVFNGTFGGTCMARFDSEMRLANTKDCLSMQAFSLSITTGDFGVQQTIRSRESATEYFEATINELERIDFDAVEVFFIGYGINDYQVGIPIYDEEEPYNPYTFIGALRSTVKVLKEKYPNMRIVLLTPTYTWYPGNAIPELTCEEYNLGGGKLEEYVDAAIQVAEGLEIEVIDLYHDFYSVEQWSDWEIYTRDGVHPTELARNMIADKIYGYLME